MIQLKIKKSNAEGKGVFSLKEIKKGEEVSSSQIKSKKRCATTA